jgi:hypothetical protein
VTHFLDILRERDERKDTGAATVSTRRKDEARQQIKPSQKKHNAKG